MTARLLVIMGSGETSPTMVTTHKALFDRLGPDPVPAVILDTPFGFQENADDISAKAVEYFAKSVGREISIARYRSRDEMGSHAYETMLARLREARYAFAGPGSPSYALSEWTGSPVPEILASKLALGGAVIFASAAALTLGLMTVPVYEVYKVGQRPRWLEGLDLLGPATGMRAAVIPHYNNAEGGNHDTRFCYLGERRLRLLEAEMPEDTFVLGVDEHTGVVFDLEASTASIVGLGVVTVRRHGESVTIPSGTTLAIAELASAAAPAAGAGTAAAPAAPPVAASTEEIRSPLMDELARLSAAFDAALARGDGPAAAAAVLDLENTMVDWSRDTLQSDELDRARAGLRSMVVRLGERVVDPAALLAPFVEAMLDRRTAARAERRFGEADAVRDRLVELGVEVHDGREGATTWSLASP